MPAVRVLEEAPDLATGLEGGELAAARAVPARAVRLDPGPWDAIGLIDPRGALGLLVLDGLLLRELELLGSVSCTELLGRGDILRPWVGRDDHFASIPTDARWEVATPVRVALLDRRFALAVARWPEVAAGVLDRSVERSRSTLFQLAVCHLTRVDVRLLVTLWHLADRFGRVTPEGVLLPLALAHRTLASIVGARRPSVTTALSALRGDGHVERVEDGWLLHGDPPEELDRLRRQSGLPDVGP